MKRFGDLFEKITDLNNLKKAFECASKGKKHYKQVQKVARNLDFYLKELQTLLKSGKYEISEYKKATINERGKQRTLHKLPFYPNRIVQWAIMLQIEFAFERHFCYHTCASLKGRGIKRAAILARRYASQSKRGKYCLKIDIAKFYDNIAHEVLKSQLLRLFKDKRLLNLLFKIIDSFDSGVCADFEGILSGGYGCGRHHRRGVWQNRQQPRQ